MKIIMYVYTSKMNIGGIVFIAEKRENTKERRAYIAFLHKAGAPRNYLRKLGTSKLREMTEIYMRDWSINKKT